MDSRILTLGENFTKLPLSQLQVFPHLGHMKHLRTHCAKWLFQYSFFIGRYNKITLDFRKHATAIAVKNAIDASSIQI